MVNVCYIPDGTVIKMQNENEVDDALESFKKNGFWLDEAHQYEKNESYEFKGNGSQSAVDFYTKIYGTDETDIQWFNYTYTDGKEHTFIHFSPKNFIFEKVISDNTIPFIESDGLGISVVQTGPADTTYRTGNFSGMFGASIKIFSERFHVASYLAYMPYLRAFVDVPRDVYQNTGIKGYSTRLFANYKYITYHRINPVCICKGYGVFKNFDDFADALKVDLSRSLTDQISAVENEIKSCEESKSELQDKINSYDKTITDKSEDLEKLKDQKKHIEDDVVTMVMNANLRGNS